MVSGFLRSFSSANTGRVIISSFGSKTGKKTEPAVLSESELNELSKNQDRTHVKEAAREFCTPILTKKTKFELGLIESAKPIELPSGIRGLVWGEGPRVLLVHGWCGRGTQLGSFVEPLTKQGYSVMAIDCWGHGESPGVLSNGVKFAESIREADEHYGPFEAVVGHSLGAAAILIELARGLNSKKAVLIAPPAILNVMRNFARSKGLAEPLVEAFVEELEEDAAAPREEVDYRYLMDKVTIPILLIHDLNDKEIPIADTREHMAERPNVSFFETSGLGHLRIIRSQSVVAKSVEFILA